MVCIISHKFDVIDLIESDRTLKQKLTKYEGKFSVPLKACFSMKIKSSSYWSMCCYLLAITSFTRCSFSRRILEHAEVKSAAQELVISTSIRNKSKSESESGAKINRKATDLSRCTQTFGVSCLTGLITILVGNTRSRRR